MATIGVNRDSLNKHLDRTRTRAHSDKNGATNVDETNPSENNSVVSSPPSSCNQNEVNQ